MKMTQKWSEIMDEEDMKTKHYPITDNNLKTWGTKSTNFYFYNLKQNSVFPYGIRHSKIFIFWFLPHVLLLF